MTAETLYSMDTKSVEVAPPEETASGSVYLWPGDSSSPPAGALTFAGDPQQPTYSFFPLQAVYGSGRRGWLRQARVDLAGLRSLVENWDTYGGHPPTEMALASAGALLDYIEWALGVVTRERTQPYFVGPLPNGGVTIEWRNGPEQLGIDVEPTGQFGYILVEETPAGRRFREEATAPWPEITDLLARTLTQR